MLLARRAAARACEHLEGILPQMHAYGEDAAELLRSARPRNDDAIDARSRQFSFIVEGNVCVGEVPPTHERRKLSVSDTFWALHFGFLADWISEPLASIQKSGPRALPKTLL